MPVVSAFYAALLGMFCIVLSLLVIQRRIGKKISIGDGGDATLARLTRVFGNFVEYAPMFVMLLALAEMLGLSKTWLIVYGVAFLAGRLSHAIGLYRTLAANIGRTLGVALTLGTLGGLAISLLRITLPKL